MEGSPVLGSPPLVLSSTLAKMLQFNTPFCKLHVQPEELKWMLSQESFSKKEAAFNELFQRCIEELSSCEAHRIFNGLRILAAASCIEAARDFLFSSLIVGHAWQVIESIFTAGVVSSPGYMTLLLAAMEYLNNVMDSAIRVEMLTRPHVLEILFSFLDGSGRGLALGLIEKISYCFGPSFCLSAESTFVLRHLVASSQGDPLIMNIVQNLSGMQQEPPAKFCRSLRVSSQKGTHDRPLSVEDLESRIPQQNLKRRPVENADQPCKLIKSLGVQ